MQITWFCCRIKNIPRNLIHLLDSMGPGFFPSSPVCIIYLLKFTCSRSNLTLKTTKIKKKYLSQLQNPLFLNLIYWNKSFCFLCTSSSSYSFCFAAFLSLSLSLDREFINVGRFGCSCQCWVEFPIFCA